MKKYLVAAIVLFASSAYAQTPPAPSDPRIDMYRQLLGEANERVVQMSAQAQQLQQQVQMLGKQLADAQAAAKKAAEDAKPAKDAASPHKP